MRSEISRKTLSAKSSRPRFLATLETAANPNRDFWDAVFAASQPCELFQYRMEKQLLADLPVDARGRNDLATFSPFVWREITCHVQQPRCRRSVGFLEPAQRAAETMEAASQSRESDNSMQEWDRSQIAKDTPHVTIADPLGGARGLSHNPLLAAGRSVPSEHPGIPALG
jgi:hypothetical protein